MTLIRHYEMGRAIHDATTTNDGVVQIVLDDGRTAQIVFRQDGGLSVRAWGNVPGKLGNRHAAGMHAEVHQPADTCDKCYNRLSDCGCGQ